MAPVPDKNSIIAATRFGLGMGPNDAVAMGSDPKGWLLAQVDPAHYAVPADRVKADKTAARLVRNFKMGVVGTAFKKAVAAAGEGSNDAEKLTSQYMEERRKGRIASRDDFLLDLRSMVDTGCKTDAPFRERLVHFWTNHFATGGNATALKIGPVMVEEAIRPHVLGTFADMLLAVTRHPAMLYSLNNNQSVGPKSPGGMWKQKGLNENLGREILELHSLGVDGGYTQEDVIAFAKALTGWTVSRAVDAPDCGRFVFRREVHEPGAVHFLGNDYAENGEAQAQAMIKFIATHPSTARHIAQKLAQHFIDDKPSDADVSALAGVFTDTGGDLAAVYQAIVALSSSWSQAFSKLKQPWDLVISSLRVLQPALDGDFYDLIDADLRAMGQPAFRPPGPQGWYDTAADWSDPSSFRERAVWASSVAHLRIEGVDPVELASYALGSFLDGGALKAIKQAESREDAVTILFASPDFQRR